MIVKILHDIMMLITKDKFCPSIKVKHESSFFMRHRGLSRTHISGMCVTRAGTSSLSPVYDFYSFTV